MFPNNVHIKFNSKMPPKLGDSVTYKILKKADTLL